MLDFLLKTICSRLLYPAYVRFPALLICVTNCYWKISGSYQHNWFLIPPMAIVSLWYCRVYNSIYLSLINVLFIISKLNFFVLFMPLASANLWIDVMVKNIQTRNHLWLVDMLFCFFSYAVSYLYIFAWIYLGSWCILTVSAPIFSWCQLFLFDVVLRLCCW